LVESQPSRRDRAQWQRTHLIDTALQVFAEKGLDGATVKDLSEAAGVSEGLMYHYFRSKEDLLRAILEQRFFLPELQEILSPDQDRPTCDVLVEVVQRFAMVMYQHRLYVRLLIREAPTNPHVAARLAQAQREGMGMVAQYLEARIRVGELRPHDAESVARLLTFATITPYVIGADTEPDARFLSTAVDVVLYGIARGPSGPEGRLPNPSAPSSSGAPAAGGQS
jgi:AcrR family transcriptional regulator